MTQRDMMRSLVRNFGSDEDRICSEYALAESHGQVQRRSNRYNLTADEYARRLLRDGQKKGSACQATTIVALDV